MRFVSKYKEHRIVLIPDRYIIDNYGRRILKKGIAAEFNNHIFETEDPEVIKLLKESQWYGVDFRAVGDATPMSEEAKEIKQKETESAQNTLTSCPYCAFNAKTYLGLKSHIKYVHPDKVKE
jgi:hypothetical protein